MTRSEEVIQALVAALEAKVALGVLPTVHRNEALPDEFEQFGSVEAYLNLVDGTTSTSSEALGGSDGYELAQECEVELIILSPDRAARDAVFDAALEAIHDALADPVFADADAVPQWTEMDRSNLVTDDLPQAKAAAITITIEFLSNRPF